MHMHVVNMYALVCTLNELCHTPTFYPAKSMQLENLLDSLINFPKLFLPLSVFTLSPKLYCVKFCTIQYMISFPP